MYANLSISQRFVIAMVTILVGNGIVAPMQLNAQASNATIVGTVTDSSGATISGATILVKNAGTGISQNTTSDPQGRYRVSDLVIGEYEVQSSNPGFQTVVHKGITLTVGSSPVVDFVLPVGQAQQTVTVEAEVSQVDTQSTAVGALVEGTQIRNLPLNGRNFTQLMTLAPGVTQIPRGLLVREARSMAMGRNIPSPGRDPLARHTCWTTRT